MYRAQGDFSGRAGRSELWLGLGFVLAVVFGIALPLAWILFPELFGRPARVGAPGMRLAAAEVVGALAFWAIFTAKPLAALMVRRLHDLNRPATALAVALIPVLGQCIVLVWFCLPGTPGPNRFGPPPA